MSLPFHHSHERDPGERGFAFGRSEAARVQATIKSYRKLFAASRGIGDAELRTLGQQVGRNLSPCHPALVEEIEGIARGSRQDEATLLAINARTEVLGASAAPECSLVAVTPEASAESLCLLAQNWDWHPALAHSRILWRLPVEMGEGWMVTLTEAGILGKIGFNSRRLACGLNFLATTKDGGVDGVPIHALCRLVMSRCATVVDALRLLLNTKVAASSCITLATATASSGVVVSVELSPGGASTLPPTSPGVLVHTNHFLQGPPAGDDIQVREYPGTLVRLWELEAALARHPNVRSVHGMQELLRSHLAGQEAVCKHETESDAWSDRRATLASIIMDVTRLRLWVSDGPPCEAPFEEFSLSVGGTPESPPAIGSTVSH